MREMTCAETARAMLAVLGENGENWAKEVRHTLRSLSTGRAAHVQTGASLYVHCMIGAWEEAEVGREQFEQKLMAIQDLSHPSLPAWTQIEWAFLPQYPKVQNVPALCKLASIIMDQFPERIRSGLQHTGARLSICGCSYPCSLRCIMSFNDSEETCWEDVRQVLEKLAVMEDD